MSIFDLNLGLIAIAAVIAFVIGSLWYSPLLFGKQWQAALGKTEEELGGMAAPMIFQAAATFCVCWMVAVLQKLSGLNLLPSGTSWLFPACLMLMGIASRLFLCHQPKLIVIDIAYIAAIVSVANTVLWLFA